MRTDLKTETPKPEEVTDSNYGRVLDQYITDMEHNNIVDRELKKMEIMEKNFQNSFLDFVFPWHMQLGRFDKNTPSDEQENITDFAYTPFKTFNRRRNYLIWMFSKKFDKVFTDDERLLMA